MRKRIEPEGESVRVTITLPPATLRAMQHEQADKDYPSFSHFLREVWKAYRRGVLMHKAPGVEKLKQEVVEKSTTMRYL